MDPTANLIEQRAIIARIHANVEIGGDIGELEDDCARLADLVEALDGWLSNGGFLPAPWAR